MNLLEAGLLVLIALVLFSLLMWMIREVFKIDLPFPFGKEGFLSTYEELHAAGEGFWSGFKTWNPAHFPDCPEKYLKPEDESPYYYGFQVIGWCVKIFIIVELIRMNIW